MEAEHAAQLMQALASPVRLKLYQVLLRAEPQGLVAGDIAQQLELPASNLSFHLKALVHTQLLTVQAEGRFMRYRLNLTAMQQLVAFLTESCCLNQTECF